MGLLLLLLLLLLHLLLHLLLFILSSACISSSTGIKRGEDPKYSRNT